jgi:hypothetical protein
VSKYSVNRLRFRDPQVTSVQANSGYSRKYNVRAKDIARSRGQAGINLRPEGHSLTVIR